MTRPTLLAATAGAAVLVMAVGQSVHLLTVATDRPATRSMRTVSSPDVTRGAEQAAIRFAQQTLACPRTPTHPADRPCGALRDIDTAPQPIDPEHVVVLLTATLHPLPPATTPITTPSLAAAVPVALRLLVTRTDGAWVVVGGAR